MSLALSGVTEMYQGYSQMTLMCSEKKSSVEKQLKVEEGNVLRTPQDVHTVNCGLVCYVIV